MRFGRSGTDTTAADILARLIAEAEEIHRDRRSPVQDPAQAAVEQDPLIPLFNRRAFLRELVRFMDFSARYNMKSSAILLQLNGLAEIERHEGYEGCEEALRHVADLLIRNVRSSDVIARVAHDAFAVILVEAPLDAAAAKAASLATLIASHPLHFASSTILLSLSHAAQAMPRPAEGRRPPA